VIEGSSASRRDNLRSLLLDSETSWHANQTPWHTGGCCY